MPEVYAARRDRLRLENHRDAQDIEFTVEQGRLYMLQTPGEMQHVAAVRMAAEMVQEG
jgi:pyruvate,orthophosphate dikinase